MFSRLNGRSFLRTIDGNGVDVTSTLKFEPAPVLSTIVSFDQSDVRYSFLLQFFGL